MDKDKLENKRNELMEFDAKYNKIVVGVDEAGRGPLAGPVVAGAVIVIQDFPELQEINDSKKLTEKKRERLFEGEQECIVKGDSKSLAIATASIVAKVTRDRILCEIAKEFPEYEFEKHKGYGTKKHREILLEKGACRYHRKTFLKKILGGSEKKK